MNTSILPINSTTPLPLSPERTIDTITNAVNATTGFNAAIAATSSTTTTANFDSDAFINRFTDILTHAEYLLLLKPPYSLTASLNTLLDPTRTNRARRNSYPPRPRNSWLIFRTDYKNKLRVIHPDQPSTIEKVSKLASSDWANQSEEVKQFFTVLSKMAKKLHEDVYPNYIYHPRRNSNNGRFVFRVISEEQIMRRGRSANERNRRNRRDNDENTEEMDEMRVRLNDEQRNSVQVNANNIAGVNNVHDNGHLSSVSLNDYDVNNPGFFTDSDIADSTPEHLNIIDTLSQIIDINLYNPNPNYLNQIMGQENFTYGDDNEIGTNFGIMSTQPSGQILNHLSFEPSIHTPTTFDVYNGL
ncbi:5038_t:CDS:1 [Paraglomus brasilianum]|uniref:5038_t:CDS:1 n=1 Tax=Paraglomus brasilianum TaxID=144538 RepID=A0A9N8ZTL2_9GLOM|nr:5038_t:CDS:1 [Paraglomus brasilianum]